MHSPQGCQEKGKALIVKFSSGRHRQWLSVTLSLSFIFPRCENQLTLLSEDGRSGCVGEVSLPDSESGQVTTVGPLLHPLCGVNRLRQGTQYYHFSLVSSICD